MGGPPYSMVSTALVLFLGVQLKPDSTATLCPIYLSEVLPIVVLVDIFAMQPVVMMLTYGYRWIVSDPENGHPMEQMLHPRDCIVREVEDDGEAASSESADE